MHSQYRWQVHSTAKAEHPFDCFSDLIVRRGRSGGDSNRPHRRWKPVAGHDLRLAAHGLVPDFIGTDDPGSILNMKRTGKGGGNFREVIRIAAVVATDDDHK